ncbi:MAG: hypothetical protein VYA86_05680 [Candidatus Thermoplasmatota archaeon]|nr:hypothetical protein [Candidatus Thermoplasmatota archaeon]
MAEKRGLARGLDDLLAQHDHDLPFLDAYGPAMGDSEGLPAGTVGDPVEQLVEVIERTLSSEGQAGCEWISIEPKENGVQINFETGSGMLPLVPSDLGAPGFEDGNLEPDRSRASVTIVQWGIPARRLLERLCEHWSG